MLTQIYEIPTPEEARSISEIGVNHIGVLVGNGEFPRELSVEAAARIAVGIVPPSKFSALFLTADISLIEQWALELRPDIRPPERGTRAHTELVFDGSPRWSTFGRVGHTRRH